MGDLSSEADAPCLLEGCDSVVHCAIGTAWGDRRAIFDVTVEGTRRLTEAPRPGRTSVRPPEHVRGPRPDGRRCHRRVDPCQPPPGATTTRKARPRPTAWSRGRSIGASARPHSRLANVYGPFSTIFVTRPVEHLAKGRLVLAGPAGSIPSSTVYVDTVVEAITGAGGHR